MPSASDSVSFAGIGVRGVITQKIMETKSIIQATANIIRITQLAKGNVYKRIEEQYSDVKIRYGVVINIFSDGQKAFIETVEYEKSYSGVSKGEIKVFAGDKDINICPCTPEDVQEHFGDAIRQLREEVETKRDELEKAEKLLVDAERFANGEMARNLSTPVFTEGLPAPVI
jgi:hypothetical protein